MLSGSGTSQDIMLLPLPCAAIWPPVCGRPQLGVLARLPPAACPPTTEMPGVRSRRQSAACMDTRVIIPQQLACIRSVMEVTWHMPCAAARRWHLSICCWVP